MALTLIPQPANSCRLRTFELLRQANNYDSLSAVWLNSKKSCTLTAGMWGRHVLLHPRCMFALVQECLESFDDSRQCDIVLHLSFKS